LTPSTAPFVLPVDSLRQVLSDIGAGIVVYDASGRRVDDGDPTPLAALAPTRLADLIARSQRLAETPESQIWRCDLATQHSAYLFLDRKDDQRRPSVLIISGTPGSAEHLLNSLPIGILILDANFEATLCNRQARKFLHGEEAELLGSRWHRLFPLKDLNALIAHFGKRHEAGLPFRRQIELSTSGSAPRFFDVIALAQWRAAPASVSYCLSLVDMGRERRARMALERSASQDALTQLMNRHSLVETLDALPAAEKARLGVAFIDLDGFKAVNDRQGHSAGDELLRIVAMRLRATVRSTDLVARLGGDEFVVACPQMQDDGQLTEFGAKLGSFLNNSISLNGQTIPLGASIGLVHGRRCLETAAEGCRDGFADCVISMADSAMYEAKRRGKGAAFTYSTELREELARREQQREEFRRVLADTAFTSVFQPIYRRDDLVAVEALMRVGVVLEAHDGIEAFIETAKGEKSRCLEFLDGLTRQQIMHYGEQAQAHGCLKTLVLNVNIDVLQLLRGDFPGQLAGWCREAGLATERVCIEVTETALERHPAELVAPLQVLREAGFRLSMDDFGTGYSSLQRLMLFEFDQIKIDRFFIEQAMTSERYRAVVSSMVTLGKAASMQVLAEGVETEAEMRFCLEAGVELLQGFYLGRPDEFASLLSPRGALST